jgi:hypothetical protein
VLGDAEGEFEVAQFCICRCAPGHDFQIHVVDHGIVAALHQKAAGHRLRGEPDAARIRQATGEQQP